MMVAGTSIGAAMIAMPISAAKVGLMMSILILAVIAFVMFYVADIALDIYKTTDSDATIAKIAGMVIGNPFQIICTTATLALLYSLLVAYISGLSSLASNASTIDYEKIVIAIDIFLFVSLSVSHKIFDYYNRAAFSLKIIFMSVMIALLTPHVSTDNLIGSSLVSSDLTSVLSIMPVFVTSFGFHASIPFIYKFVDRDEKTYLKSVKYGVSITLLIYIIWLSLIFGVVQYSNLVEKGVNLEGLISQINIDFLSKIINFFAMLAILTSLFGVATGLYDFIEELLRDKFRSNNRFIISGLTFGLPLIFCISGKDLFIKALSFAGCALTIIAIIIPVLIRIKLGGNMKKSLLIFCFVIGLITIVGELLVAFGLIN